MVTGTERLDGWTLEQLHEARARIECVIDTRHRIDAAARAAGMTSAEVEMLVLSTVELAAGAAGRRPRRSRSCS